MLLLVAKALSFVAAAVAFALTAGTAWGAPPPVLLGGTTLFASATTVVAASCNPAGNSSFTLLASGAASGALSGTFT